MNAGVLEVEVDETNDELLGSGEALHRGWWPRVGVCCRRWEKCPPCQGGRYGKEGDPQHRQCWGYVRTQSFGPSAVTHDEGAIGSLTTRRNEPGAYWRVYVYEAGYHHRTFCDCCEAGHPGINRDKAEGSIDIDWLDRRGLFRTTTPALAARGLDLLAAADGTGTPSLFDLGALA